MSILDAPISRLDGTPATLRELAGTRATLVVNVASECGMTPQYGQLQELHEMYAARGLGVVGVPCNQFGGQEPGSPEQIAQFCSTTYDVSFPLTEKVAVNGSGRHPLYAGLVETVDAEGHSGDIRWNFEKFLVDADGRVVGRFGPRTDPADDGVVGAIEELLYP